MNGVSEFPFGNCVETMETAALLKFTFSGASISR